MELPEGATGTATEGRAVAKVTQAQAVLRR